MNAISVGIVDDSDVFRAALKRSLTRFSDVNMSVEASEAVELLSRLEDEYVDVILVDLRMPGVNGIELTEWLREQYPSVATVALTVSDDVADLAEVLRAGSSGYILKTASPGEIADAIRQVAGGQAWVSQAMARTLVDEFKALQMAAPRAGCQAKLTVRENAVLREMALGRTNREIGERLYIAETTVKSHIKNILEKLEVRNRVEAVLCTFRGDDGVL